METRYALQVTHHYASLARYERRHRRWERADLHQFPTDSPVYPFDEEELIPFARQLSEQVLREYSCGLTTRLIIPAEWCFLHLTRNLPKKHTERTAIFAVEPYIPMELEQLTCVCSRLGSTSAVVTCVPTSAIQGLMSTFAERNIHVDSAIVDAALWPALQRSSIATEHAGLILLDSSRMTLIHGSVSSRSVTHLRSILLPDSGFDTGVLRQAVSIATQALPGNCSWNILMLGDESALRALPGVIEDTGGTFVITPRNEATDLILDAAIRVTEVSDIRRGSLSFSGRWKPLRQGATKCALSCIAVLLLLIIRALWENARYSTAIAQVQPMQAQIYRRAIGDPVPLGAALRLRSELIKLEALTDRSTNQNSLPQSSGLAAFELLHEMMLKIPDELKLNVSEILIDEQAVRVVGQTSSHSAAGELVRQLNLIPDLTVNPPRTKLRQDRTVDFHIYGIRKNQEQR